MKKLIGKRAKKLKEKSLTADTIDEHRDMILARGKKYKIKMNEMQRRVVVFAGGLAAIVLVVAVLIGWLSLYVFQSTGDIAFRLTRVIPVPVATVEGEWVRYSDYLLIYRSSIAPVERQNGKLDPSEEGDRWLIAHYKRAALNSAQRYTYAKRLARDLNVFVTDELLGQTIREYRIVGENEWSEASFIRAIRENFGLSRREYEDLVRMSLLTREVAVAVDVQALDVIKEVERRLAAGEDFVKIADAIPDVEISGSDGMVDVMNLDGGRAKVALGQSVGDVSDSFVSRNGDGYYIVKTTKKENNEVEYTSLFVRFMEFDRRFSEMREAGGIREFIRVEEQE